MHADNTVTFTSSSTISSVIFQAGGEGTTFQFNHFGDTHLVSGLTGSGAIRWNGSGTACYICGTIEGTTVDLQEDAIIICDVNTDAGVNIEASSSVVINSLDEDQANSVFPVFISGRSVTLKGDVSVILL